MTVSRLSHLCRACYLARGAKSELLDRYHLIVTLTPCEGCGRNISVYKLTANDPIYGDERDRAAKGNLT